MPPLTRWFIKASLVFLVLAMLTGLAYTANVAWRISPLFGALGPVYYHLFLVGWVTQIIFGVVYWMFPKYSLERPRGSENLGWATFWLLNFGLIMRTIGEPLQALHPGAGLGWLLAISAVLQWLAGLLFVTNSWGRVKEK